MGANKKRMSLREGEIFLDGMKVIDAKKISILFKPDVQTSKALGEPGTSRRYLGHDIEGSMTKYKNTFWLKEMAKKYISSRDTPEFTIQAIHDDKGSDSYPELGAETVTISGVVFTGDIPILELDVEGNYAEEALNFGAVNLV